MLAPRIIPCLLVQDGGLVKTVNFASPKYVGDPINAVRIFNEKEVDELIVLDIDATPKGNAPDYTMIGHLAAECRMPLCYGGGVTTSEQVQQIVSLGVEKVALNSAAIENPALITESVHYLGSQSIVVVLDVRRRMAPVRSGGRWFGGAGAKRNAAPAAPGTLEDFYEVWSHGGRRNTGKSPRSLAKQMVERGAGEIVINSIDNDGVMRGYDMELIDDVRSSTDVPLTVLGGAGSLHDLARVISRYGSAVGVAAGSLFVFKGPNRAVLITYPGKLEKDALRDAAKNTQL